MTSTDWDYAPARENRAITAISGATGLGLACGLAAVFNPAALGLAAGYALFMTGRYYQGLVSPAHTKAYIARLQRDNQLGERYEDPDLLALTGKLSRDFNLAAAPQLYPVKPEFILKHYVPWFLRPLMRREARANISTAFSIWPPDNLMLVPREGLNRFPKNELNFILAHELAHQKARDDRMLLPVVQSIARHATNALLCGTLAVAGLSALGLAAPAALMTGMPVMAALGFIGLLKGASILGFNAATRIMERRADRNAVFITRDLESAEKALRRVDPSVPAPHGFGRLGEILHSHPSYPYRMESLKKAWNKIKDLPAPIQPDIKSGPDSSEPGPGYHL